MTLERAPAPLWSAAQAAAADRYTMDELQVPSPILMERAALTVSHQVAALSRDLGVDVVVLCGPGNNGGDGLAVARQLHGWGLRARAVLVTDQRGEAAQEQLALARAMGVTAGESWPEPSDAVMVDAMLGTGSRGAPRGTIERALIRQRAWTGPRVAIDLPSGLDPDTGRVHTGAFGADITVTFVRSKPGLHVTPGRGHAGRVVVADIGIVAAEDAEAREGETGSVRLADPQAMADALQALPAASHKGQRGHVAIVGGSAGTPGAAVLAAAGAMRAGAGLATVVTRDPRVQAQLLAHRPELMVAPPDADGAVPAGLERAVLCVGPGLTEAAERHGLARLWREDPRPAVWDASALDEVPLGLPGGSAPAGPRIVTPHPGEAARLLARAEPDAGWDTARVQSDRLAVARRLADLTGAVAVLKGEGTVVATPRGLEIIVTGGPALATAGSGDVLAGLAAALCARGLTAPLAASTAAHVHGVAGDRLAPGALAMDVADAVPDALDTLHARTRPARWPALVRG